MSITATCPGCSTSYKLADTMRGKQVRCKSCSEVFVVRGKTIPTDYDEDEERIQSSPHSSKRVAWDEEDEDTGRPEPYRRPRKKRSNPTILPLVIGGCIAAGVIVLVLGGFAIWALGRARQAQQPPVAIIPPNRDFMPPQIPAEVPMPPDPANANLPPMAPPGNPGPANGPLAVQLSNGRVSGFGAQMQVEVDYRFTSGNPAGRRLFLMIKATKIGGLRQNYYLAELRSIGGQMQGTVRASGMSFGIEHGPFEMWIGEGTAAGPVPLLSDRDITKISNVVTVASKQHALPGMPGMPGMRQPIGPRGMRP